MSTGRVVFALVAGLAVGGVGGVLAGGSVGTKALAGNWAQTDANNAAETLEVLRALRGKKPDEALEKLEVHLNRHLFGLTPANLGQFKVSPSTLAQVEKVTEAAIAYRTEFPRPPSENLLEKDVAAFLGVKASEPKK